MQALLNAMQVVTSVFSQSSPLSEGSRKTSYSGSTEADDSFEFVDCEGEGSLKGPKDSLSSEDSFEVDLDLEDLAILQFNLQRKYLPDFNSAGIGKTPSEATLLEQTCSHKDFKDTYSKEDNGQILVLTSKCICLIDSTSKEYIKKFSKREIEKIIFLSNTVFFQRKQGEGNKPREVIIADRRRHMKLGQYLEQFWTNYL